MSERTFIRIDAVTIGQAKLVMAVLRSRGVVIDETRGDRLNPGLACTSAGGYVVLGDVPEGLQFPNGAAKMDASVSEVWWCACCSPPTVWEVKAGEEHGPCPVCREPEDIFLDQPWACDHCEKEPEEDVVTLRASLTGVGCHFCRHGTFQLKAPRIITWTGLPSP